MGVIIAEMVGSAETSESPENQTREGIEYQRNGFDQEERLGWHLDSRPESIYILVAASAESVRT